MPLPRYQHVKVKTKSTGPSINDLDDYCLSRIIGHVLSRSSSRDVEPFIGSNEFAERSLSLVSKRWYFLTQTQIAEFGVHEINLDEILKRSLSIKRPYIPLNLKTPKRFASSDNINYGHTIVGTDLKTPHKKTIIVNAIGRPLMKKPTNLLQKTAPLKETIANQQSQSNKTSPNGYDINLFRAIRPKLLKYRHIQINGTISCENFVKFIITANSTGVKRLDILNVNIDGNIDQLGEYMKAVENFKLNRSQCKLNVYLKDQKASDCEEKIKMLNYLSRLGELTVYISASHRISIDCCHLMWSTGRAIKLSPTLPGRCVFKIILQTYNMKPNSVRFSEITVPFGENSQYSIDPSREDIVRYREIMKSLKRDCYHSFVKSVRETINAS